MSNRLIYIEGKANKLFVYIYLVNFEMSEASKILDFYITRFESKNFKMLNILFWNKGAPGEFLSMFRKNINKKCTKNLLKGISYIKATFDYMNNIKVLNNPVTI